MILIDGRLRRATNDKKASEDVEMPVEGAAL
jgi:hypothetical protein